jgi:hypothetical protein
MNRVNIRLVTIGEVSSASEDVISRVWVKTFIMGLNFINICISQRLRDE